MLGVLEGAKVLFIRRISKKLLTDVCVDEIVMRVAPSKKRFDTDFLEMTCEISFLFMISQTRSVTPNRHRLP